MGDIKRKYDDAAILDKALDSIKGTHLYMSALMAYSRTQFDKDMRFLLETDVNWIKEHGEDYDDWCEDILNATLDLDKSYIYKGFWELAIKVVAVMDEMKRAHQIWHKAYVNCRRTAGKEKKKVEHDYWKAELDNAVNAIEEVWNLVGDRVKIDWTDPEGWDEERISNILTSVEEKLKRAREFYEQIKTFSCLDDNRIGGPVLTPNLLCALSETLPELQHYIYELEDFLSSKCSTLYEG